MVISKREAFLLFELLSNSSLEEQSSLFLEHEEKIKTILRQIEKSVERKQNQVIESIEGIKYLENRTLYVGNSQKFSKGCISCLCGNGLNSIRKTNVCNLRCQFCYYYGELDHQKKVPDGMWQIGRNDFFEEDIERLIKIQGKPTGVSYAYLEPFVEIEKYYNVIKIFNSAGIHQHLYTNGVLVTENSLKELKRSGLDEIRFNLGATNCDKQVIDKIGLAKEYIPKVGIETPMTQEFFEGFNKNKKKIFETGFDFINCAELHLNENNIGNYLDEKMYMSRTGYISPVWSRLLTLEFMKIATQEKWDFVIHDCSNLTKYSRELNYGKNMGLWFGAHYYGMEFEQIPYFAFLPILRDDEYPF